MRSRPLGLATFVVCCAAATLCAQWPSNPAENLALADRSGEQTQSKVRPAADGGCWISWYDNAAGGYDMSIQRLSAEGVEQFAHNGVLVKDLGFSSTQDYDLRVDHEGNAVLVFRDDRALPGSVQITVQKISPTGALLFGDNGVQPSSGTTDKNNPKCAVLPDNSIAVGWTVGGPTASTWLQVLDGAGSPVFAAPTVVSDTGIPGRPLQLSDIQATGDGQFVVLFVRCTNTNCVTSNKHLYAQKFTVGTIGADAHWDRDLTTPAIMDPIIVFDGTSIQTGTFPAFFHDGSGGGIFGWYENGGSRRAYVQHIAADGSELFAHNGVPVLTTAGIIQISAGLSYDAVTGDICMAVKTTNAGQSQWGIRAQRVSAAGTRQWGDDGVEILPMNPIQSNFERSLQRPGGGCDVYWLENSATPGGRVLGFALDSAGAPVWPGITDVCSVVGVKGRLDVARGTLGNAIASWNDSRNDQNDIYAQSVLPDGSLGPPTPPCPADFNGDGFVNPDDLSDFVICFFLDVQFPGTCAAADFNGDTFRDPDDLSDFITSFFTSGC